MPKIYNKRSLFEEYKNPPADAVYCGRGTKWGNPFRMRCEEERDLVCDQFEMHILPTLDVSELRGKDLICWCAPLRCHCDAILKKANEGM